MFFIIFYQNILFLINRNLQSFRQVFSGDNIDCEKDIKTSRSESTTQCAKSPALLDLSLKTIGDRTSSDSKNHRADEMSFAMASPQLLNQSSQIQSSIHESKLRMSPQEEEERLQVPIRTAYLYYPYFLF